MLLRSRSSHQMSDGSVRPVVLASAVRYVRGVLFESPEVRHAECAYHHVGDTAHGDCEFYKMCRPDGHYDRDRDRELRRSVLKSSQPRSSLPF